MMNVEKVSSIVRNMKKSSEVPETRGSKKYNDSTKVLLDRINTVEKKPSGDTIEFTLDNIKEAITFRSLLLSHKKVIERFGSVHQRKHRIYLVFKPLNDE